MKLQLTGFAEGSDIVARKRKPKNDTKAFAELDAAIGKLGTICVAEFFVEGQRAGVFTGDHRRIYLPGF